MENNLKCPNCQTTIKVMWQKAPLKLRIKYWLKKLVGK